MNTYPPEPTRVRKTLERLGWTALTGLVLWFAATAGQAMKVVELPKAGEAVALYSTQTRNDLRQLFLGAFDQAEESLLVIIYALTDHRLLAALANKAAQGCKVEVICDKSASKGVATRLGSDVRVVYSKSKGLMHQKIVVADGELVVIGSANMTTESLRHHGNIVAALRDEELGEVIARHAEWLIHRDDRRPIRRMTKEVAEQTVDLRFLPADTQALDELAALLDGANHSLRVAMYTWTHPRLTKAVIDAHQRGVDVAAVVDRSAARGSSKQAVKQMAKAGVNVAISDTAPLLHYKIAIVDEQVLVSGSANWTRSAFNKNDDCLFIIHKLTSEQLALLTKMWRALWAESRDVETVAQGAQGAQGAQVTADTAALP